MPHLFPEEPVFQDHSESEMWERLRNDLPADACLIANLTLEHPQDGPCEADLVVIWPNQGVAVLEVKGGHVTVDEMGNWWQNDRAGRRHIRPHHQAKLAMYAIQHWIQQHTQLPNMRMCAMVVTPYSHIPKSADHGNQPRELVIDDAEVPFITDHVRNCLGRRASGPQPPTADFSLALAESLHGGLVDRTDVQRLSSLVPSREAQVADLVRQQEHLLEHLSLLDRFLVLGAAGTGKTALAMAQARRLAESGERVLLTCYTKLLAQDLRRKTELWPRQLRRQVVVSNFHDLVAQWHHTIPENLDSDYYERQAPLFLMEAAANRDVEHKFDALVIDEAQDFDDTWWDALTTTLRDALVGKMFAFGDEDQTVFDRQRSAQLLMPRIFLPTNLRNTRPIAKSAAGMISHPPKVLDFEGAPVFFVPCDTDEAVDHADEVVDYLMENWVAGDIALLTTGHRHGEDEMRSALGEDEYAASLWERADTFYATAMKFKGLERPAVVVAVNGFMGEHPHEVLYVALTRARDLCVICGDPTIIRPLVGEAVFSQWQPLDLALMNSD